MRIAINFVASVIVGDATMAVVRTVPAFQADLAAARAEMAAVRRIAPAPDAARCVAERKLVDQRIY